MKEEQTKLKANIKRKINILVENIEIRKKNDVVRVAQQSRLHVRNEKMIRKKKRQVKVGYSKRSKITKINLRSTNY